MEINGMRDFAKEFYHSAAWIRARDYVMTRDFGLCQQCRRKGKITPGNTVHHIIHLTPENINDVSISLNPDNLETLCQDCHAEVHRSQQEPNRFTIDEFGELTIEDENTND